MVDFVNKQAGSSLAPLTVPVVLATFLTKLEALEKDLASRYRRRVYQQ